MMFSLENLVIINAIKLLSDILSILSLHVARQLALQQYPLCSKRRLPSNKNN
jgi:hypothetical protein